MYVLVFHWFVSKISYFASKMLVTLRWKKPYPQPLHSTNTFTFKNKKFRVYYVEVWANHVIFPQYRNATHPNLDTSLEKRLNIFTTCSLIGRKSMWSTGSMLKLQASWAQTTWWTSWWRSRERRPRWLMRTISSRSTSQMKMVSSAVTWCGLFSITDLPVFFTSSQLNKST